MRSKDNNYAFIDSQNLNLSVQSLGWRLDFAWCFKGIFVYWIC